MELRPEEEQALESFIGHEFVVKQGGATLSTHTMRRQDEAIEIDGHREL